MSFQSHRYAASRRPFVPGGRGWQAVAAAGVLAVALAAGPGAHAQPAQSPAGTAPPSKSLPEQGAESPSSAASTPKIDAAALKSACLAAIAAARSDRRGLPDAVTRCQDAVHAAPEDIELTFDYGQILSDALVFDELAVLQFRKAAEKGHAGAENALGIALVNGRGVEADPVEGVRWIGKAAEQGLADAQNNLGSIHAAGIGVPKDLATAAAWFRKAAEEGDAQGAYNVAEAYAYGEGLAQDWPSAIAWYEKASGQGMARADYRLSRIYAEGLGIAADPARGFASLQKAAEAGYPPAAFDLGEAYRIGNGVAVDAAEATRWYRLAATRGHAAAQFFLALGLAQESQFAESAEWLGRAAEQGHPDAQYMMGLFLAEGLGGGAPDPDKAVEWYRKAAAQGQRDAITALETSSADGEPAGDAARPPEADPPEAK